MKKGEAPPPVTDRLKKALEDVQGGNVRIRAVETIRIPGARAYTAGEIRGARSSLSMSQSEFAELLQVSIKTVQAWEAGRRSPSQGQARWIEMFTGPEWADGLRKPAPHPRAPKRGERMETADAPDGVPLAGPVRRPGGREKARDRTAAAPRKRK